MMRRNGFIRAFAEVGSLEAAEAVAAELRAVLAEQAKVGGCEVAAYYKVDGWFKIEIDLTDFEFLALRDRLAANGWVETQTPDEPSDVWNPNALIDGRRPGGFAVTDIVWALLEASSAS